MFVRIAWKPTLRKYSGDTVADDRILRGLDCLRGKRLYFTPDEYDAVYDAMLAELSAFGYGIETIGEPSPGCGVPTHVAGTNGGRMPCGATLKDLDGTTATYFCGPCQQSLSAN